MSEAFRRCCLGDVIKLQRGHDLPQRERVAGTVPIVSSSGVSGTHNEAKAKAPGVITGRYGTLGQVYYLTQDYWPLNTTLYVKDFKGNHPRFIFYLLKSLDLERHSAVSAVPGLNRNDLHKLQVTRPGIEAQRRIADILGALDDKIELNRKMNQTLEEMAQALYKHWFVDFGPFRDGEFVDSELGPIPKGWEVTRWGDIASIAKSSIKPLEYPDETFLHHSIPSFDDGRRPVLDVGMEIKSGKTLVQADSVLVSKLNPRIYRVWSVKPSSQHRCITSTEFINYVPKLADAWSFVNCHLRGSAFMDEFRTHASGTTGSRQRVRPATTLEFKSIRPPASVFAEFNAVVSPLLELAANDLNECDVLAETRDYLLPKLLSGEIEVEAAEELVEDVG